MPRTARLAATGLPFPSATLGEMADHTALLGDAVALRQRLADVGYLRLRGLIPPERVRAARRAVADYLHTQGCIAATADPLRGKPGRLMGNTAITHHPALLAVLEAAELRDFFTALLGEPARTYDFKWLRAVPPEGATGEALSLSASLVFEQSYSGVDGDSASCAELYALLSALADAPIRQSLAVTGSVTQTIQRKRPRGSRGRQLLMLPMSKFWK